MTQFRYLLVTGLSMAAAAACMDFESDMEPASSGEEELEIALAADGVWSGPNHGITCSDECADGTCACLPDKCGSANIGDVCSPVGDTCNKLLVGNAYKILRCVAGGVWTGPNHLISCSDECASGTCGCLTDTCGTGGIGDVCAPVNATCLDIVGSGYRTLTCK